MPSAPLEERDCLEFGRSQSGLLAGLGLSFSETPKPNISPPTSRASLSSPRSRRQTEQLHSGARSASFISNVTSILLGLFSAFMAITARRGISHGIWGFAGLSANNYP